MKKLIALLTLAFGVSLANAGEFVTANYGRTNVKDWQDLVARGFTARFPSNTWDIFIYSDAFTMSGGGQAVCNAIVGVVPRDTNQFPRRQFVSTKTATVKPGRWNNTEALNFETECVRAAIANMMNADTAKVYRPHSTTMPQTTGSQTQAVNRSSVTESRDLYADPNFWEDVAKRNGMTVTRLYNMAQDRIDAMAEAYIAEMQAAQAEKTRQQPATAANSTPKSIGQR